MQINNTTTDSFILVFFVSEIREGPPIVLMDKEICKALLFLIRKVTFAINKEYLKSELIESQHAIETSVVNVNNKDISTLQQPAQKGKYDDILLWILTDLIESLQRILRTTPLSEEQVPFCCHSFPIRLLLVFLLVDCMFLFLFLMK
jgi:hypothetical protein